MVSSSMVNIISSLVIDCFPEYYHGGNLRYMRKIGWKIEVTSKLVKAFRGKRKTKFLLKMLFVTFKINCAGVYFTYNKLYPFEVYIVH